MDAFARTAVLSCAAALVGAAPAPAAPNAFTAAMQNIVSRPRFAHAIIAGEVYDLDGGRVLYRRNDATLMEAASTTKLVTTGTALALLGPDFRLRTPLYRTGPIDAAGTVHGDLVLVASGDANLSQRIRPDGTLAFENEDHSYDGTYATRAVPGDPLAVLRDLAAQTARAGVRRVDGRLIVDASLFEDGGPEAGTGAAISPIVVNDNLVDVAVTPGVTAGDPVRISVSPQTPYATFVSRATTAAPNTEPAIDFSQDKTAADGTHVITITGVQPAGAPMLYAYRVPEPRTFARIALAQALRDAGVTIPDAAGKDGGAPVDRAHETLVAQHVSLPLAADVAMTLKVSDNLHADLLPYLWALHSGAKRHLLEAAFAQERALLSGAGLDVRQAAQQDGLGGFAFFTPNFMVRYLAWARRQAWYSDLLAGLPVLGVDGTLFNIQNASPARGRVFAKTGTWGSENLLDDDGLVTKGLAGYTTTRHGRHLAFAFYINRMAGKGSVDLRKDAAHVAGETLGEMAADAYLLL